MVISTTILFEVRDNLQLTNNEYILLDIMLKMQSSNGYFIVNKQIFKHILGINEKSVLKMIDKFIDLQYIQKQLFTDKLIVTDKIINEFLLG